MHIAVGTLNLAKPCAVPHYTSVWCVLACECIRSPSPQEWLSGATPCPFISAAVEASVLKENEAVLRRAVRDQLQPLRDHLQTYGVCA